MISDDVQVIEAMNKHGGGFIKRLAELASVADSENLAKLKHAFSHYWDEYRELGKRTAAGILVIVGMAAVAAAEPLGVSFRVALLDDGADPVPAVAVKVAGEKSLPDDGWSTLKKWTVGLGSAAMLAGIGHEAGWWDLDGSSSSKHEQRAAAGLPPADNRAHNENTDGEQTNTEAKCVNSPGCRIEINASLLSRKGE